MALKSGPVDRREFAGLLAGVLAVGMEAQGQAPASTGATLPLLQSGVFVAGVPSTPQAGRSSRRFLQGMLKAGNLRLEIHETVQQPGAVHEPVGTHLHNEIWCVQRGVGTLFISGVEHHIEAGDVGLVCAGDTHWIKNEGDGEFAYFVITVGPPE